MKSLLLTLGSLLTAWVAGTAAQEDFGAVIARADRHFLQFENRQASSLYQRALELRPEDFRALEMAIRAHHDLGLDLAAASDNEGARSALSLAATYAKRMEVRYPERAETYFYLAATSGSRARFEGGQEKVRLARDVERNCKRAITLNATYALPHAVLGVFYRELAALSFIERAAAWLLGGVPRGGIEEAVEFLSRAVELDSKLSFAWFELAVTQVARGESQAAEASFLRVTQLPAQTSQDVRNGEAAMRWLRTMK